MDRSREIEPSELFVLRTPLLPFEEIEAWGADLDSPRCDPGDEAALEEALAHDRALLRERLRALFARPELREALLLGSESLLESLETWEPGSRKARRIEQSLVRYLLRMATRPTPFGLFSGWTAGSTGERTRLKLADRGSYRRSSRLDTDYLFLLCDRLRRDPELRSELPCFPNSSLYQAAGRLRYSESRPYLRIRRYHLVAVEPFEELTATIERAAGGARPRELAEALMADGEITLDDALAFVHDLVDNQILVPDLAPPVTGAPGIVDQLEGASAAAEVRERLARADRLLGDLDARPLGSPPERYREIARGLAPLGIPTADLSRLFQVDLLKPASEAVLGRDAIDEILRGVGLLHRIQPPRRESTLAEFRDAFRERYGEGREMPLLEVLDEEIGIGFDRLTKASADASPLLADLRFRPRSQAERVSSRGREAVLLALLSDALAHGRIEVELTEKHVAALASEDPLPLPDAFHAMVRLAERGEIRVLLDHVSGPSGARLLGRLCHSDERIRSGVQAHLAREEALAPDAIYAEIAHLPAGPMGNVLSRPVLRAHEIPFLGRSGAPRERQIPAQDLTVTVLGDRVVLRSRSLGREVLPRLTAAHYTVYESLGLYRLAGALQEQGRSGNLQWSWSPFETAAFLPRVTAGRLVLSRARWRILADELRPLLAARGAARYRLAQELRRERRLPRLVCLAETEHELLLDFDNPLVLDAVLDRLRGRSEVVLTELFPSPDELGAVQGPEGRFFHEVLALFTRRPTEEPRPASRPPSPAIRAARSFPPGSEWLDARIYTGTGTADSVLLGEIAPLAREALDAGHARSWHFLRSADPDWHLVVRFHGDPESLQAAVQPRLQRIFRGLLEEGRAWKCQLDTYVREIERYGGEEGIVLSEKLFFHDSEAAVDLLEPVADLRWRFLLAGLDRLLEDFGYDMEARLRLIEREHARLAGPYQYEILRPPLKSRLRQDRAELERLLTAREDAPDDLAAGLGILTRRSEALSGIVRELRDLEREGRLSRPLAELVPDYLHLSANRLSRSAGEEHEIVIYDYLVRIYRSLLARG